QAPSLRFVTAGAAAQKNRRTCSVIAPVKWCKGQGLVTPKKTWPAHDRTIDRNSRLFWWSNVRNSATGCWRSRFCPHIIGGCDYDEVLIRPRDACENHGGVVAGIFLCCGECGGLPDGAGQE